jgi:formate hydrogenlyase subunit 5
MTTRPVRVRQPLVLPLAANERRRDGEEWFIVDIDGLAATTRHLLEQRARFVTAFVTGEPELSAVVVLARRGSLVALRAPLEGRQSFPALASITPAAAWPERAIRDGDAPLHRPDADRITRHVHGSDTFVIPYGPVRSGIFESIQFMIETGGEDVLSLETRPAFKHRALEHRFHGLSLEHGVALAERVAGIASVAHATAFAQAVERALEIVVPRRAELWRTIHAELERVANHLDVAAKLAEDCALSVGQARMQILKEDVLRLRAALCGSRYGRGLIVAGGITAESLIAHDELAERIERLDRELRRDRTLLLETTSFTDRLIGSGRLDRATLESFGGVGPIARASDVPVDARFERPYAGYRVLGFRMVTRQSGDAMARLSVRFGEIRQSLHLIRQALDRLARSDDVLRRELPNGSGNAFGWSEAPQGELVYWVEVAHGRIAHCRIASPSARNWPLFTESFRGDVLTDFGFIEHSFGLTPAGADR